MKNSEFEYTKQEDYSEHQYIKTRLTENHLYKTLKITEDDLTKFEDFQITNNTSTLYLE